jgi:hypothetical protein
LLAFLAVIFTSCLHQTDKEAYNPKLSIQYLIQDKTNLLLDTNSFTINLDSVKNTEGAFDLDYTWFIKTQFDNNSFEKLKQNIRSTIGFCAVNWYEDRYNEKWAKVDTSKIKGVWTIDSVYFKFVEKPTSDGFRREILRLSFDSVTRKADIELVHL